MEHEKLLDLTMTAIDRAMAGDSAAAATALVEIGQSGDPFDVFGACCAFAHVGKAALTKIYGDKAPDPSHGDMWAMQMLDATRSDPAEVFACRFIVAYANDDKDLAPALFRASLEASDEEHVSSVSQLLATAVSLSRTARTMQEGQ
ncbi:hypothetical protein ACFXKI_09965 [Streptomyces mirabilis]|uniref:hypothetical protein n=1 Tax=Streptomyces mirabilis TaxID=68239 RepID=UPI0036B7D780